VTGLKGVAVIDVLERADVVGQAVLNDEAMGMTKFA
jgi:hypothetical protein